MKTINPKEVNIIGLCESLAPEMIQADHTPPKAANGRTLKIEEDGDYWKGTIRPKIRLKGQWLERAGFKPGNQVSVKCLAPGIIELCSADTVRILNDV